MEKIEVNLFDAPADKLVMPSENNVELEKQKSLIENEIEGAIFGAKVKTVVLSEDSKIEIPNYVLDFSECTDISIFQKECLKNLRTKDGDTAIYMYNKQSILKIGYGHGYKLENLLALTKKHVFGDSIKIYRNVEKNKPLSELITRDITKLRLNL